MPRCRIEILLLVAACALPLLAQDPDAGELAVTVRDADGGETYLPIGHVAWVKPWRD